MGSSLEYSASIAATAILLVAAIALDVRMPIAAAVDALARGDLAAFIGVKESEDRDPRLDWSDDGCSAPLVGSTGASFDFTEACERHDFAYRNYKRIGLIWGRREAADRRFLRDMLDHCATRSGFEAWRCRNWAHTFYLGVRAFG